MTSKFPLIGVFCVSAIFSGTSASGAIIGRVWQNEVTASHNATIGQAASLGTPDAMFDPVAIDFDSRITGYTLNQFLHSPTFYNTQAGFDPNASSDNTYYLFTGELFLHAGANNFLVPHDDGLQLNIDTIGMVVNQPGPTAPVNTPFVVTAPSDGLYSFELSYGETDGPPGVLSFKIDGAPVGNVPESGATIGLMGLALATLGGFRRRVKA
jgi:hypothetical protein